MRSRITNNVQRSPKISSAQDTGQGERRTLVMTDDVVWVFGMIDFPLKLLAIYKLFNLQITSKLSTSPV